MRIAYIAAGAGGMYCGSCLRDNALANALLKQGRDVVLIPAYTPMRADEECAAAPFVLFGALNVYLKHAHPIFRRIPAFLQRLLDRPALLNWVSRMSAATRPESLGALAETVLRGEEGPAGSEFQKLAAILARDIKPDIVNLPNSMLAGAARAIKRQTGAPVVVTLSGEDSFIEALPEPYRGRCRALLAVQAKECDAFVAGSRYYADFMAQYLQVPRERIHVVPLGINLEGHGQVESLTTDPFTIAFMARISPDKGLRLLAEAFVQLKNTPEGKNAKFKAAGYLDPRDRAYLADCQQITARAGLSDSFAYAGELDRPRKISFIRESSVLCVPTAYPEPKGLFALEALANGVPVVLPRHGAFPELIEATQGGVLVEPNNPAALAAALRDLLLDPERASEYGRKGCAFAHEHMSADAMARGTYEVYRALAG